MSSASASAERALVIIPTFNERQSLPQTLDDLRSVLPDIEVLVVDDASPDGTGRWAEQHTRRDARLSVLHRPGKAGLGAAYLAGFDWALQRDYEFVIEMDADGSHRPSDLVSLLAAMTDAVALVIGSRWVPGGAVRNWSAHRQWLSKGANRYTEVALGLKVNDSTAGFRVYRAAVLRRIELAAVQSQGYCFQIDLTRRVRAAGGRIVEVPITFVERTGGVSKMDRRIVGEALWRVTAWGVRRRLTALRRRA